VTKKIERVYPNLLWAVNKGYARIVERLLARMTALSPPARPSLVLIRSQKQLHAHIIIGTR
jgi:hypothetical protein